MVASIGAVAPRPRARATTSGTATTRGTTRPTGKRAPGPARARRTSASPARSIRTSSRRCWRARRPTAPAGSSDAGGPDGALEHRPGRDLTFSAPKSVSLAALIGGDGRIVEAHDRAVKRTLSWVERNVAETRMKDPETGRMVRAGRSEDGGRDLPARRLAQSRSPASHPFGDRQHGPGRGRQVADHVQREALCLEDADRRHVPERTGAGSGQARLRDREDPC